jgi:O-antigen/teichoic acid export membrane protein
MPADDVLQDAAPSAFDVLDSPDAGGQVVRGSTMRVVAYGGGLLVGLASTPLVVRHLGVVDYGRYATVVSLMFIVTAITEGGLAALGLREFATLDQAGRASLIRNLLGLRIVLVTLASALAVGFAVVAGYTHAMVAGVLIMSGGLMVLAYQDALSLPLKAGLRLGWVSLIDFLRQLTVAVLMVVLVVLGASLLPFYVAIPVSSAVALVVTVALVRRDVPLLPAFSLPAWARLLRQTLLYAAASALGILYFQMALILTSVVSTPRQTGLFGVSFRIVELANGIPWLVTTSAFPVIARAAHTNLARLRYALQRMFEVGLIAGTWFTLAIVIGAPFAIAVVAGHKFQDSVTVLRILGVIPIGTFLIATWAYALLALRAYKGILISNAIAVAAIGTLTPILASAHGAIGAAVAAAVTEYVLAACYAVALMRSRPEMRVSLAVAPRVLLAALVASAVVLVLAPPSVVGVAVASVVYAAALWLLRAVPSEVIDAFMGRLRA